jgi:hypothetical protein
MIARALRGWGAVAGLGLVASGLWLGGTSGATAPRAHAARTIRVDETARLHLVKKSGPILKERGSATGTLPGPVSARFDTSNIAIVTGTVTFHTAGGSVTVSVIGYPQSLGTVAKFAGSIRVLRGTGRFAHPSGSGSFTGKVNRSTWAVRVHGKAKLTY